MNAYIGIFERYADESAFLWLLRSLAVDQPHYNSSDVAELEHRLDAQLDGLMTSPEEAWTICREAAGGNDAGDAFTASVLAFRCRDVKKIQHVVERGMANEAFYRGLISALGWLPGKLCHSWIKKFLKSKDFGHKELAISACSARGEDPGEYLSDILARRDCQENARLYASAIRLAGELKRQDLAHAVSTAMSSLDKNVQFWANWSSALLGNRLNAAFFQPYVQVDSSLQSAAIDVAFRVLSVEEARRWIGMMIQGRKQPEEMRPIISALAVLGDPHAVDWLVAQMRIPALSRLSGEAFGRITGIDLVAHRLVLEELPNLDDILPNDDPSDTNVDMDEDEHLPFPDADKVAAVWQRYRQRFTPGRRHFLGSDITSDLLKATLRQGTQRQRAAAAIELALLDNYQPLINHRKKVVGSE